MLAKASTQQGSANQTESATAAAHSAVGTTARRRRTSPLQGASHSAVADKSGSAPILDVSNLISPADALGSEVVKSAGNREMLVFAQEQSSLLRRQEALFRQASAWLEQVPEPRREGVRQAVLVYAQNVRAWQMQTLEQEAAFLLAQDKDQQARARFMLAEKAISDAAGKKYARWFGMFPAKGRRQRAQDAMAQAAECAAAVRESLNGQGLAIHRYMRFQAEWRRSMEEMLAFVAEQSGF